MKKLKNMKKKTKTILLTVLGFVLIGTSGGVYYAQEVNNQVEATQKAYWSIVLPSEKNQKDYNEHESYKLDVINQDRYYAFHQKNVETLNQIQPRIDDLELEVTYRKLQDKLNKIKVHKEANKSEKETFNKSKKEIETMITEQKATKEIEAKIEAIKKLDKVTSDRLKKEAEAKVQQEDVSAYPYTDEDDYYSRGNENNNYSSADYSYGDGGSTGSGGSTDGGGSTGGGSDNDNIWGGGCTQWGNCSTGGDGNGEVGTGW